MRVSFLFLLYVVVLPAYAQIINLDGRPGQLEIRAAGEHGLRITLKPLDLKQSVPYTPAVAIGISKPVITLQSLTKVVKKKVGDLMVEVRPHPLTIVATNIAGQVVQQISFEDDGRLSFQLDGQPVLGMGEGGPKPVRNVNWRELPVTLDRSGLLDSMQPRWQADAYGSRNPVSMLIGTGGWAMFVATPWTLVDLRQKDKGFFIPWKVKEGSAVPQTQKNQQLNLGKGIHPVDRVVPGVYDFFIFDAHDPLSFMKDFATVTGPAALPPKWALGYMQSHRTLETDSQMTAVVDRFREKKIPVDAVIYLGTGFTPRGWNKPQPSFEFNPEVFKNDPKAVIEYMHSKNVKVLLHMVPWDRDKLPSLHGTIPPRSGEVSDAGHINNYWTEHVPLINMGVDGFWPDEGDWFNLFERIKRHQLYYQGHLSSEPNKRPWSLHRNGYPGIAQWGGWVWSGDTESSWKTLEAQVAVGINYSLSVAPFWGSDIGGFYPNEELTGELYIRWHQFAAFCSSFRAHGRTWWTRLPWGWGGSELGPLEGPRYPLQSELNNPSIEPIAQKYNELRYQLLSYNYTLAREARDTGLPMMRSLWLHYPADVQVRNLGSEYLWGRDLLVAPVFIKDATERSVYLPEGEWYDWWTFNKLTGGKTITRAVDLATMPIYVRAGAIVPIDPVRQYTGEIVTEPTTLRIFSGVNGEYMLYDDDGVTQQYLQGNATWTKITWNDRDGMLTLEPYQTSDAKGKPVPRVFRVEKVPTGTTIDVNYTGKKVVIPVK